MITLLLNADYSPMGLAPLSRLGWRDAIKAVYLEQVEVVETHDGLHVHSPSTTMQLPSVVVSKIYIKTSRSVKFNKANLCIRDNYSCQYCLKRLDAKSLTMEHVIPRCRGGKTNWQNIVCACVSCNTAKGHKTSVKPVRDGYKPEFGEIVNKAKSQPIVIPNANWIPYIGWNPRLITVRPPGSEILQL